MEVIYTSPWVPPEWIKAHGLEPRGLGLVADAACGPLPLAAAWAKAQPTGAQSIALQEGVRPTRQSNALRSGVCAFANAAVGLAERSTEAAVVFTTHCDQLRRGFDVLAGAGATSRGFLFNLPVTWQTPLAERLYTDELRRLGRFLLALGGHEPTPAELLETISLYNQARGRLLDAASWCPARPYAEAVARFHWEGSVQLPPKPRAQPNGNAIPLALVGGPLSQSQMPLLDASERVGGRIVLNATEAGERSLQPYLFKAEPQMDTDGHGSASGVNAGLLTQLARAWLDHYVDVFQRPNTRLYDWLRPRLSARQARGIILWHYVGCDLWRAEAQPMREAFGLPVLLLEADEAMPQRNVGRLEAFLESLR